MGAGTFRIHALRRKARAAAAAAAVEQASAAATSPARPPVDHAEATLPTGQEKRKGK